MIEPWGSRVAVTDPPAEEQRSSGLYIPVEIEDYHVGIVTSVSEQLKYETTNLPRTGDKVWYPASCAKPFPDGTKIIDVDCIIAIDREDS